MRLLCLEQDGLDRLKGSGLGPCKGAKLMAVELNWLCAREGARVTVTCTELLTEWKY
jgi:hypothetical protein